MAVRAVIRTGASAGEAPDAAENRGRGGRAPAADISASLPSESAPESADLLHGVSSSEPMAERLGGLSRPMKDDRR